MSRDNFTKAVIEKLKARVSNRCSNPECRVQTTAPSDSGGISNIGIAAHICAASPGGPRYDSSMSSSERKSLDNAIWLCSNCSIDIDRDLIRYTVDLLKEWKQIAENNARLELGKKIPSHKDTVNTITASLTGLGANFVPTAISNVHIASEKALEALDERFKVQSFFDGNMSTFRILAKETVPLQMIIPSEAAKDYQKQYMELVEHGKDVEIDASSFNFEGSRLFEELFNQPYGKLNISATNRKAIQKIWLVEKETSLVETFDDIHGDLRIGTKSFNFTGKSCADTFSTNFSKPITENKTTHKVDLNFTVGFERWEGTDIQQIKYFEKFFSLFEKIALGWQIFTSLEVDGSKILTSQAMYADNSEFVKNTNSFLHYINSCRIIGRSLGVQINFKLDVSYSAEEHKRLAEITDIISGNQQFKSNEISDNLSTDIIVTDKKENVDKMLAIDKPISMRMVQNECETVELFGQEVVLPPKVFYFSSVTPKIYIDISNIQPGDTVNVEWIPEANSKFVVSYEL
ncbi:hypothetical protein [Methylophaga thiooxydans]|uniref:Uncharacterized protein n=1 Tax=Methylophaga thiooxydans DMS010 TaxID=637616 RepID=C0N9L7_9GAMM|nr:hypothetical protein [Methylophaga thiooxydans]EEF78538.1 hypothetical protein MDMS009_2711 [Methylophaga thiooxydans DMS010]